MKHLFVSLIVIVVLSSCLQSDRKVVELEDTVLKQAREIEQLKGGKTAQDDEDPVATELRVKRKACTKVTVSDYTARIYFCGMMDTAFFLENPEPQSRLDLNLFLEKTGFETGLIEYFTPQGEKIFSITGSLSSAETKRYH